jgi:hypothetical protein
MDCCTLDGLMRFGDYDWHSEDKRVLKGLISGASNLIELHTGRVFVAAEDSDRIFRRNRYVRGHFNAGLLLLRTDLATDPSAIVDGNGTDVLADCYYLDPYEWPAWGIVREAGWTAPVTVTGRWAYSVTPPADIEYACMRLCRWMDEMNMTTRQDGVVVTEQGAVLIPSRLPQDVLAILNPYRAPRYAG